MIYLEHMFSNYSVKDNNRAEETARNTELSFADKFTRGYQTRNREEIEAVKAQMKHEIPRREVMLFDSRKQTEKYQREMTFEKGKVFRETKEQLKEIFSEGAELLYTRGIYQSVSDGILKTLGVPEENLPPVRIISSERELQKFKFSGRPRGRFLEPDAKKARNQLEKENGRIDIFLPNFGEDLSPEVVFGTLAHECFHAYQNSKVGQKIPPDDFGDAVAAAAYVRGKQEYVAAKRNHVSYERQGYEVSAKEFGKNTVATTMRVLNEAMREA